MFINLGGGGDFLEEPKVTYYAMKISPFRRLHTKNVFRSYDSIALHRILSYIYAVQIPHLVFIQDPFQYYRLVYS
jgi:hypothetical protein